MIDTDDLKMVEDILNEDETSPILWRSCGLGLLTEVKRLREGILDVMAGIYDNMYDMNQALDRLVEVE